MVLKQTMTTDSKICKKTNGELPVYNFLFMFELQTRSCVAGNPKFIFLTLYYTCSVFIKVGSTVLIYDAQNLEKLVDSSGTKSSN
jgi:hypothetical protein